MCLDKDTYSLHPSPHGGTLSARLGVPHRQKSLYKTTNDSVTISTGGQYSRSLMIRFEEKALLKLQVYGLNYILMCAIIAKGES